MFYDFPNYLARIPFSLQVKQHKNCALNPQSHKKNSIGKLPSMTRFLDHFVSLPPPLLLRAFALLPHSAFRSPISPTVILEPLT